MLLESLISRGMGARVRRALNEKMMFSPNDGLNQFLTSSHRVTPFFDNISHGEKSRFFFFFFFKFCQISSLCINGPNLYFAWKIGNFFLTLILFSLNDPPVFVFYFVCFVVCFMFYFVFVFCLFVCLFHK